ncbi:RNA-directed DNA polymerase from mobile element jockey [Stylophora pistillata]|uniref:RNA-directed DNA polymerase from mobile element jockey n=1 Tax=Stylophora pistillata TaxID=50429 RepID=A0A2B4RHX6_STYPI|nr:RNA-directed DNA polymerase from mobile element jockey [Stylophora pistillata]
MTRSLLNPDEDNYHALIISFPFELFANCGVAKDQHIIVDNDVKNISVGAFDKVTHNLLLSKLEYQDIKDKLLCMVASYLTGRQQRVVLEGSLSYWLPVTSGVPQGSILGPLLFLSYYDMSNYIYSRSTVALFVDNSKLYQAMDVPDVHSLLQDDLDSLNNWRWDWAIEFNPTKCKVLHISKRKSPTGADDGNYSIGNQQIEWVSSITDLGITVPRDLSWARYTEDIVMEAEKPLSLVERIRWDLSQPTIRRLLYCALVRPKLKMRNVSDLYFGTYLLSMYGGIDPEIKTLWIKVYNKAGLTPTPMSTPTSMPMSMPTSMQTHKNDATAGTSHLAVIIVVPILTVIVVGILALIAVWRWKKRSKRIARIEAGGDESKEEKNLEMSELDSQDNLVTSQVVTKMV